MFRPSYSTDYFKVSEDINEIPSSNSMASQSFHGDLIPLRWIPWEVYIMVRVKTTFIQLNKCIQGQTCIVGNGNRCIIILRFIAPLVHKERCLGLWSYNLGAIFSMQRGCTIIGSYKSTSY